MGASREVPPHPRPLSLEGRGEQEIRRLRSLLELLPATETTKVVGGVSTMIEVRELEGNLHVMTEVRNRWYQWNGVEWITPAFGVCCFGTEESAREYISENISELRESLISLEKNHSRR
jgi:hypothetical protein